MILFLFHYFYLHIRSSFNEQFSSSTPWWPSIQFYCSRFIYLEIYFFFFDGISKFMASKLLLQEQFFTNSLNVDYITTTLLLCHCGPVPRYELQWLIYVWYNLIFLMCSFKWVSNPFLSLQYRLYHSLCIFCTFQIFCWTILCL